MDVTFVFIVWLYLFCHFGDEVTNRYIYVNDLVYKSAWYLYPIEIRKDIRFAMRVAQRPVFMKGFANIQCTRFIFQKVKTTKTVEIVIIFQLIIIFLEDHEHQLFDLYNVASSECLKKIRSSKRLHKDSILKRISIRCLTLVLMGTGSMPKNSAFAFVIS